jgi:hypothetical protein
VPAALVAHVNHVLTNRFRQTRVIGSIPPDELDNPVSERCVETGVNVPVDGVVRDAIRIDTDPDVQGVGVDLGASTVLTVVIARDALPYVDMAFAVRLG